MTTIQESQNLDSHGEYPAAMKELGKEENVTVIDLTAKSKALFEEPGFEQTKNLFLWLAPGEYDNDPQGVEDNTHFQENGARMIARLVLQGIDELTLVPFQNHFSKNE